MDLAVKRHLVHSCQCTRARGACEMSSKNDYNAARMNCSEQTGVAHPLLFYRATCPRCRFLSAALVALSVGIMRRVPNTSAEATAIFDARGVERGKLALLHRGRLHVGRSVFAYAWVAVLWCIFVGAPKRAYAALTRRGAPPSNR